MMKKDPFVFVNHVLESIQKIEEYTEGLSKDAFAQSSKTQDAVIRNLEIIGEATKNISQAFRKKYPQIPWQRMTGLRDILIHLYFGIDLNIVWEVVERDLPELKEKLMKLKAD